MLRGKRTAACAAAAVVGSLAALSAQTASGSTATGVGAGRLVYVSDSNDYGRIGLTTFGISAPNGAHRQILSRSTSDYFGLPSLSADGKDLAYFGRDKQGGGVRIRELATGTVTDLFTSRNRHIFIDGIAISSDDSQVFYGSTLAADGRAETKPGLWVVPAAGGTPRELTANIGAYDPTTVPGDRIVYLVSGPQANAPTTVWEVNANGSDAHKLFSKRFGIHDPSVSPNGRWLAFDRNVNDTTNYVEKIRLDGRDLVALTPPVKGRADYGPSWSPNGRNLAFLSSRAGRYDVKRSQPLFDGYEMTATGADVHAVITFKGDRAGLDWLSWGA